MKPGKGKVRNKNLHSVKSERYTLDNIGINHYTEHCSYWGDKNEYDYNIKRRYFENQPGDDSAAGVVWD